MGQENGSRQDTRQRFIGIVLQETTLFAATVAENITFGCPGASEEEMVAAARAAQAHDFIMQLEKGYETIVGERGYRLSGGEKQRISIARVLLKKPRLLILDEATSHLDALTAARVWQALDCFMAGRTTIIISHQRANLAHVDQTISLDKEPFASLETRNMTLP